MKSPEPIKTHETSMDEDVAWVFDHLPTILPATWRLDHEVEDGRRYANGMLKLCVILSGATEEDGRRWLHVSVSHRDRIPNWRELVEVKELFLGKDSYAYQVLPPEPRYINTHPHVLHLWCCLDATPLPDFTRGGKGL